MANKVDETNASLVYHEIRVDKDVPDDLGTLAKLRLIYNGISANAWLTPVGIRHVREPKFSYHGGRALRDELRSSISDRACSASSIMGIRHYELDRQKLGKHEMLLGVKVGADFENRPRASQSARKAAPASRKDVRRPQTSFPINANKKTEINPKTKAENELPDLCITQIFCTAVQADGDKRSDKETIERKQELTDITDLRRRIQILNEENARFPTVGAMHEACKTRRKSTVPQKQKSDAELSKSTRIMQEVHVPYKGPMLKPLLYKNDDSENADHSSCKGSCKGCFRACLASDDFFEKAKSRIVSRPMRTPRKHVSYRLRPALRMAFLEQLVISKQPHDREVATTKERSPVKY